MIKLRNIKIKKPPLMKRFIIFSTILFLFIFAIGGIAFLLSMQHIIRTNKGSELSKLLEIERIELESSLNREISIVLKMASSPLVISYFANPDNLDLKNIAHQEIAAYSKAFVAPKIFWVNDVDRLFYFDDNEPYLLNADKPENYWYYMTINGKEPYNFNINYNPDLKVTNLWINAPVVDDNGKPHGMVGTGIELSRFITAIYEDYKGRAQFYFFNANGEITGAKDIELVSAKRDIERELSALGINIVATAKNLKSSEPQTLDTPLGRIAISSIPLLEWYSIAILPDNLNDYKTPMTMLFIVVMVAMAVIFVIFNIFIFRLLDPLRKTMEELKAASRAKSDFLAKMSHEIRTPMNAITGMAELALRENMPASAKEHVLTIKRSSANLLSIINDILDFSKIESGRLEIVLGEYQLSSLFSDVISIIKTRIMDSRLRFSAKIDSSMPNVLLGDEIRIRQVLLNVLGNAVKYTNKGFISFSVGGEMIDEETILLTIDIADSGKGIKEEDIGKLFGDFVQLDLTSNKGIEGTGLGLAITRSLIKEMGGDIEVKSEYHKGSTFTITLPQKICSLEPVAFVEKPEENSILLYERREIYADSIVYAINNLSVFCHRVKNHEELLEELKTKSYNFLFVTYVLAEEVKNMLQEHNFDIKIVMIMGFGSSIVDKDLSTIAMPVHSISIANMLNGMLDNFFLSSNENTIVRFSAPGARVLIVDDINTNLKVAEGLMLPYKMQLDLCTNGADAIDAVKGNRYDLVFMDHMMPDMDGIEATKIIRGLGHDLPIIALTANAVSGTKEMFLKNGFNDFLSKPIDTIKLNVILEKWLPKKKQEKPSEDTKAIDVDKSDLVLDLKIRGVDVKKGVAMMGGNTEHYMQTISIFYKDCLQKFDEIESSLEARDYHLYATYVHALKSTSATIGAASLSEEAKNLEAAGKCEDSEFIKQHNPGFIIKLKDLVSDINDALSMSKENEISVDVEVLRSELNRLKEALIAMDSFAINSAAKYLQEFTKSEEFGAGLEAILQNVLIGEYDETVPMIDKLVGSLMDSV
jgi:signal transduction histidine kinase/FixJ family two-component response regulator/HPt (histidine-containing phosphotransfer) domain-containing protein